MIFHNEELFDTCFSPNNIQMIKLNRTKRPWLVACAEGEAEEFTELWCEKLKEIDHLET
jgi:hypothetical protein